MPDGMAVIVRTAGCERTKAEIKRDYEYLLRLWDEIREMTLQSTAPALIYEEGNLIKRAIRDLYATRHRGGAGRRRGRLPDRQGLHAHADAEPCQEGAALPGPGRSRCSTASRSKARSTRSTARSSQLRSGGYIVINPTEALVSIDVNSGRSTRERNIEETAYKTNLEAAEEIARQLRLRDLAGLIVIDFIDMEDDRNQGAVERRLKEAMKNDRARIQVGRISPFGLLELSRQRLRPSLIEASTQTCPHCGGTGHDPLDRNRPRSSCCARSRRRASAAAPPRSRSTCRPPIALYMLNQKRDTLSMIEQRYGFRVMVLQDDTLMPPAFRLERVRAMTPQELAALPVPVVPPPEEEEEEYIEEVEDSVETEGETREPSAPRGERPAGEEAGSDEDRPRRKRRRRKRRRPGDEPGAEGAGPDGDENAAEGDEEDGDEADGTEPAAEGDEAAAGTAAPSDVVGADGLSDAERKRRRRGKRGGRRRRREDETGAPAVPATNAAGFPVDEEEDPLGYPTAFDYARDGREHLFAMPGEEDDVVAPAAPVAEAPVAAEIVAIEVIPEEKPKRRRAPRKKAGADAPVEASAEPVAEAVAVAEPVPAAEPVAEEAPVEKPKRRRAPARKKADAEAPVEPVAPAAEPVVEAVPEPVVAAPAEVAPAEVVQIEVAQVEVQAGPDKVETPIEPPAPAEPAGPPRRGWWKRLIE